MNKRSIGFRLVDALLILMMILPLVGAAPAFGLTLFSNLSFTRLLIGAGLIKKIIFLP